VVGDDASLIGGATTRLQEVDREGAETLVIDAHGASVARVLRLRQARRGRLC
jgi:hypothetical protein